MIKLFVIAKQNVGNLVYWNSGYRLWSRTPSHYISEEVAEDTVEKILNDDEEEGNNHPPTIF